MSAGRLLLLGCLFFLISFGLGYPTLNRYDPRETGDAAHYYHVVEGKPGLAVGHWRFRVLVPWLARPAYELGRGRVGTWDPVFFGMLVVNSLFCAATAILLVAAGLRLTGDHAAALLAAALYLLNFQVPNGQLAGLVDAGEAFALMGVVLVLLARRDAWLPLLGVLGGLAKESFGMLSLVLAGVWWLAEIRPRGWQPARAACIAGMVLASVGTAVALQSSWEGRWVWPWQLELDLPRRVAWIGLMASMLRCLKEPELWYAFIWLLPLGLLGQGRLPKPWVLGAGMAALAAYTCGAYYRAHGVAARAMFDAVGPMLSLGAALFLLGKHNGARQNA